MNRPQAFVRPPNSGTAAEVPMPMQNPTIPTQVPFSQRLSTNAPPKAPPPFNLNATGNHPPSMNGRYANPLCGISPLVNGHFPVAIEGTNVRNDVPTGLQVVKSAIHPGNVPLNPNQSNTLPEPNISIICQNTNSPFSQINPIDKNVAPSAGDTRPLQHADKSCGPYVRTSSATVITTQVQAIAQNISMETAANNACQQASNLRSPANSTACSFAAPKPPPPTNCIESISSLPNVNVFSSQSNRIPSTMTHSANTSAPLVSNWQLMPPDITNMSSSSPNISALQQNSQFSMDTSNSKRNTYTPLVVKQSSIPSETSSFPVTNVSNAYVSSPFLHSHQTPNSESNIYSHTLPSSNVGLANIQSKTMHEKPSTAMSQMPIVSPSHSSIPALPITPRYFAPSSSTHIFTGGLPPKVQSPPTVSPIVGVSSHHGNTALQYAAGKVVQPNVLTREVKPPLFSAPTTGFSETQRPPFYAASSNQIPPPPTAFPINSGITPSTSQGYPTLQSGHIPPLGPYPAQFSSSQTTATSLGNYPLQQQPPSVNQLSRHLGGLSVAQQGWNKGWGTTSVDLMQQRCLIPPGGVIPPKPSIAQENVKNCLPDAFRCTFTKVPQSDSVLQKVRLPFGILIHPFKDFEQLTVVNGCAIVRCGSCRTYINPFITFKGERKWECNLCFRVNDLPEEFQYDPYSRTYGDPSGRAECREATIEYIAPQEYLLRPPQPACYLYVLDTSRQAIETGYLQIVCEVLLSRLGDIPGDKRTLIGFITFSTSIQFYMMAEDQKMVNVLDMGDINNVFLPSPQDLLVNLNENRQLVEELLMSLPEDTANSHSTESCLGAAITAAHKLLAPIGGRITVMAATLPTIGPGQLKSREDPNQRSAKDIGNLSPATDFYKKYALDCSARQIAVDLFTFNTQYMDLATLTGISKFSGGCIHHFGGLSVVKNTPNVVHFRNSFDRYVKRKIGFEAVMRIRATRGLTITNFHGNFFVRSTDLLSLPNINPDAGFGMQVIIEEPLHNIRQACFQAALLYTSSEGERRIRVHTMCLPVSANILEIMISADQQAVVGFLSKLAVDKCLTSQMSDAREAVVNACADAFGAYRTSMSSSIGLAAPPFLQLLPMYCLSILKSVALRYGTCTKLDDRVFAMCQLKSLPLLNLIQSIYPDLYAIHNLTEKGAINIDNSIIPQPPRLHLSAEFLDRSGVYLMDAGDVIIMYIRNYISPNWLNDVLGMPNVAAIPQPLNDDPLPQLDNEVSELVRNFVSFLQVGKPYSAPLSIIKEDSPERSRFIQRLIEDRSEGSHSYVEFLQYVKSQMK